MEFSQYMKLKANLNYRKLAIRLSSAIARRPRVFPMPLVTRFNLPITFSGETINYSLIFKVWLLYMGSMFNNSGIELWSKIKNNFKSSESEIMG